MIFIQGKGKEKILKQFYNSFTLDRYYVRIWEFVLMSYICQVVVKLNWYYKNNTNHISFLVLERIYGIIMKFASTKSWF